MELVFEGALKKGDLEPCDLPNLSPFCKRLMRVRILGISERYSFDA